VRCFHSGWGSAKNAKKRREVLLFFALSREKARLRGKSKETTAFWREIKMLNKCELSKKHLIFS